MNARVPATQKLTRSETQAAKEIAADYWREIEYCFYFACLIALNESFSFKDVRLKRFYTALQEVLGEVNHDIDTGCEDIFIDRLIRSMESRGINFEDIIDIDVIKVPDEYLSRKE